MPLLETHLPGCEIDALNILSTDHPRENPGADMSVDLTNSIIS